MNSNNHPINEYREMIKQVDILTARLFELYKGFTACKRGCAACCTDLTILPVEWHFIKEGITQLSREKNQLFTLNGKTPCGFLDQDNGCIIYPLRPLICRTHGLPLFYRIEEYDQSGVLINNDEPEWQLILCDLNFTSVNPAKLDSFFNPDNCLNMEEWNTRLSLINHNFLKTGEGKSFAKVDRIPMEKLLE